MRIGGVNSLWLCMNEDDQEPGRPQAQVIGLDERQLLVRHLAGDPTAFAELVGMYRAPIYSILVRSGADCATCDDLFQNIFFAIHNNAARYDPEHPLAPWIFTIVTNTLRSFYRRQKVRKLVYAAPQESTDQQQPNAEQCVEAQETADFLRSAIQKLPATQREVVLLSYTKGLEQKDIAKIVGIPVNTVKTHLRRARAALTKSLLVRKAQIVHEVQR